MQQFGETERGLKARDYILVRLAFINARNTQAIHEILMVWYETQREWPAWTPREMLTDLIAAGAEG
jgi:hypothetical protein